MKMIQKLRKLLQKHLKFQISKLNFLAGLSGLFSMYSSLKFIFCFFTGFFAGVAFCEPAIKDVTAQVYFSPQGGARDAVIREIDSAKKSILMQAYLFTDKAIAQALVKAKKRGVNIQVILDKKMETSPKSQLFFLIENRIPVFIDKNHGTAHDKILIIDNSKVLTGSYNFVRKAEASNGENLLVLESKKLNDKYTTNWIHHHKHSKLFEKK